METNLKMFIKVSPDFLFLFVHTVYLNHALSIFPIVEYGFDFAEIFVLKIKNSDFTLSLRFLL